MSHQFNDTDTRKGLVQMYEKEIGADYGVVSGSVAKLKEFCADANVAWDEFLALALPASGKWQYDDSNHSDFPRVTTDLVAGQRAYTFLKDEQDNLILDIIGVHVKDENGTYRKITPIDRQTSREGASSFNDGLAQQGVPDQYDKTANGILLDLIPSYSSEDGLMIDINREASYFVHTDTIKMPGAPGTLHSWFYFHPAAAKARRNTLATAPALAIEVAKLERRIVKHFGGREKDVRNIVGQRITNSE